MNVKYNPIAIKIEVAGLIIGEIIPLLIGFEKLKSAKTKLLIFSKSFSEFGIPKIIFKIEKSKKIETKSGEVIIKNNTSAAIFWEFGDFLIINRKCGCTKMVIKNASTM